MVHDPKKVKEDELATTDEYNGQKVPCFFGTKPFSLRRPVRKVLGVGDEPRGNEPSGREPTRLGWQGTRMAGDLTGPSIAHCQRESTLAAMMEPSGM